MLIMPLLLPSGKLLRGFIRSNSRRSSQCSPLPMAFKPYLSINCTEFILCANRFCVGAFLGRQMGIAVANREGIFALPFKWIMSTFANYADYCAWKTAMHYIFIWLKCCCNTWRYIGARAAAQDPVNPQGDIHLPPKTPLPGPHFWDPVSQQILYSRTRSWVILIATT